MGNLVHRHQSICNKNAMEWPKWTTILITLASVLVVAAVFQFRHQLHEGISAGYQKLREKYTHDEDAHIRVLTSALVKHKKEISVKIRIFQVSSTSRHQQS